MPTEDTGNPWKGFRIIFPRPHEVLSLWAGFLQEVDFKIYKEMLINAYSMFN